MNKIDVYPINSRDVNFLVNNTLIADTLDYALELIIDENSGFNPLSSTNLIVLKSKSGIKLGRFIDENDLPSESNDCDLCLFEGYLAGINEDCECSGYSCNYQIDDKYLHSIGMDKIRKSRISLIMISKIRSSRNILLVNVNEQ